MTSPFPSNSAIAAHGLRFTDPRSLAAAARILSPTSHDGRRGGRDRRAVRAHPHLDDGFLMLTGRPEGGKDIQEAQTARAVKETGR
ncbi:hypothetical protein NOGI109294_19370 [Nocardiopsis gilva]